MNTHTLFFTLIFAFSFSMVNAAEYQLADFDFRGADIVEKISIPKNVDSVVLYCQADIAKSGRAEHASCFSGDGQIELVSDTQKALSQLKFTAAQVDGRRVAVRMNFRIFYSVGSQGAVAQVYPNLGSMQSKYGPDYYEPQERLDVSDWQVQYQDKSWLKGKNFLGDGPLSRVVATVRNDGKPAQVKLLDTPRSLKRDAGLVKTALKESRFIPGAVNGETTEMPYLAVIHYQGTNQILTSR